MHAVIFDMDGTLCDVSSIRHYVEGDNRNFDKFHKASLFCPAHDWVVNMARHYYTAASWDTVAVLIVTARERKYERVTRDWLAKHDVRFEALYMRDMKDYRADAVVKQEILDTIREDGYNPVMAFEDRDDVAEVWRANGLEVVMV